jgi:hypothetical protein
MACIYRHLKPNGEVFYIGIGKTETRAYSRDRSKFWKSIVEKYGYEVQILKKDLTLEDAKELEIILIAHYGRRDLGTGTLVNMTNGGDGINGYKHSDEAILKITESSIGRIWTEELKSKMKKPKSKEHIENMKGRIWTEESKSKISNSNKGRKMTDEAKQKMSEAKIGKTPWIKGKKMSDESREKMRIAALNRKKKE